MKQGVPPDTRYKEGGVETPWLVLAADAPTNDANTECVRALLNEGASVDNAVIGGPRAGYSALITASGRGNLPVVKLLLERRANPNFASQPNGHTALMSAAGYPDVVEALLKAGAEVNKADAFGRTPIAFAALAGCPNAFDFLKSRGGDPTFKGKDGESAEDHLRKFPKTAVPQGICAPAR